MGGKTGSKQADRKQSKFHFSSLIRNTVSLADNRHRVIAASN
jgi:hypothetical protein